MGAFRRPDRPVSRRATTRPGEIVALVLAILCVTAPVVVGVWQRGELLRAGYEIESLKAERARLAELRRKLLVERASLEALPRVERAARSELGLEEPPNDRIWIVADSEARP